jgi:hypothetical protein
MVDFKVKTVGAREGKGGEKKEDKIDLLNRRRPGASPMRQIPPSHLHEWRPASGFKREPFAKGRRSIREFAA